MRKVETAWKRSCKTYYTRKKSFLVLIFLNFTQNTLEQEPNGMDWAHDSIIDTINKRKSTMETVWPTLRSKTAKDKTR